jgi:hypothetical protein
VFAPLLCGAALILVLLLFEYAIERPLIPVRSLLNTLPLTGVLIAMCAGAASVALVELAQSAMQSKASPGHAAMLFWPEFGAAVMTAVFFGLILRTRLIPVLALSGLVALSAGAVVLSGVASGPDALVVVGSGLVGLGVGASVSPALFTAGFSLASEQIARVFAVVELLCGVAAFMFAPIVLHLSRTVTHDPAAGILDGVWVCFGIAAGGALLASYLYVLGRVRLRSPKLERWLDEEGPALDSPKLAAGIRDERALAPLDRGGSVQAT